MDFKSTRISNRLIVCGYVLGLFIRIMGNGWRGILEFLFYSSIPVILLYLLFLMRALGAGDIKLFSVAGGFLIWKEWWMLLLVSLLAGAMISVLKIAFLILKKRYCIGEKHFIHFSVPILMGYLYVWGCAIETTYSGSL
ncbi:MAG: prepilin peptidase [Roseburia sp.]|uniref:prepilin peptidase n=1 Tax=Roseburia sp. 831b TaxID=1261635 RepID=UPI000951550B|nr:prepilin peptidase [Roseburia sp.]WVK72514.1 prepilin peptidase [Roseburia sp. 831b]